MVPPFGLRDIAPHLTAGKTLMFAHGFNIRYGQILPPAVLDLPRLACLNIHASMLPRCC